MSKILMKDNMIEVSVIVPMYNVENLISETIQSIKSNSCNFEVLLINDGSTDDTVSKALEAIDKDPRFILINQQNKGVSVARNKGLKLAKGTFILFVDSDDLLKENAIDKLFNHALKTGADFIYGGIKKFNSCEEWFIDAHENRQLFTPGVKTILRNPELFYSMAPHAKLISRSLLLDVTFPENITCAEDQVVIFTALVNAKKIYSTGDYVYYYRERDAEESSLSITQQKDEKAYQYFLDILQVMEIIRNINDKLDLPDKEKKKILASYYERAVTFDVWPLLIRILKYHTSKVHSAFSNLSIFLKNLDEGLVSSIPAFRYYFIRILTDNIYFIKGFTAFKSYKLFLFKLFSKLEKDVFDYFDKNKPYGKRWDQSYFIATSNMIVSYVYFLYLSPKKKFFLYFNKNKKHFFKKYWFSLCKLLPKQKNKLIFASTTSKPMGENFNHIINQLRKDNQLDKFKIYKFLGSTNSTKKLFFRYFHSATAGTIFLENYYHPYYGLKFSKKTNVVQLWHACGAFKKFAHDALNQKDSNTLKFENNAHSFYTDVVVSSSEVKKNYSSAFDLPSSRILSLGIPRTDLFFDIKKISLLKQKIVKKYPYLAFTKNILYAPTFRGNPSERKVFNLPIDWKKIKKMPRNYKLIIKLHPVVEKIYPEIPDWVKDRVLVLNTKENVNDWMLFCDSLVTDYSSLIFEYSLLNKPIIYFPFDIENYFDERGFYYPYQDYVYGDVVYNTDQLVKAIDLCQQRMYVYKLEKEKFIKKYMSSCDGNSSKRIINYLIRGKGVI